MPRFQETKFPWTFRLGTTPRFSGPVMLVTTGVDVAEQGMDYQGDEAGNGTPAGIEQGMEHQGNGAGNGAPGYVCISQ